MQQRAGASDHDIIGVASQQLGYYVRGLCVVVSPDVLAVYNACEQQLVGGESVGSDKLKGSFALDEIKSDAVKWKSAKLVVAVAHIAEVGLQEHLHAVFAREYLFIER